MSHFPSAEIGEPFGSAQDRPLDPLAARLMKIEHIELRARRLADDLLPGPHRSIFRGSGLDFEELREYVAGDDVRVIDWNVTARAGRPFVKLYREERQLSVILVVDVSASLWFGTALTTKRDLATDVAALLTVSALRGGDRVGLLLFSDGVEHFVRPRKGRQHGLRLIRDLVLHSPRRAATAIGPAARFLSNVSRRRSIIVLISDFLFGDSANCLAALARQHDVIAVTLNDPRELELPSVGIVSLEDAESGLVRQLDTSSRRVREAYRAAADARMDDRASRLTRLGLQRVDLATDRPYLPPLLAFFRERNQQRAVARA